MNFSNLVKWLMLLATDNEWSIWTMHRSQNVWNGSKDSEFDIWKSIEPYHKSCQQSFKRIELRCVLPHPLYFPNIAPSYYYLFWSMAHGLNEQHFVNFEEMKKRGDSWFASEDKSFCRHKIHRLSEIWEEDIMSNGAYFK